MTPSSKPKDREFKIVCGFCNKPLNDEGLKAYSYSEGCDTCGYGQTIDIEVYCHNPKCPKFKKVIYKKEARPNG